MKNGAPEIRPDYRGAKYAMVVTGYNWCLSPSCRRTVNKKKEKSPFCWRCRFKIRMEKNPLRYWFGSLRRTAKRRGKEFSLTFEQYKEFAERTDYARLKGKSSLSLSVDRIDNSKGYSADNIQCLTIRENVRKQFVKFYAHQQENIAYKPTEEEISAIQNQL